MKFMREYLVAREKRLATCLCVPASWIGEVDWMVHWKGVVREK